MASSNFRSTWSYRYLNALRFYLANHVFMTLMPYRLRHWYLRRVCRIQLGDGASVGHSCFVTGSRIRIGANSVVNRRVYLDGRAPLSIGRNVNISHQVLIQTLTHDPQNPTFVAVERPVVIEDHVWIGARALICPGVKLGEGAVVGAGAVVAKDVEPYTIVVGNPARVLKRRSREIGYVSSYFPFFDTDIE